MKKQTILVMMATLTLMVQLNGCLSEIPQPNWFNENNNEGSEVFFSADNFSIASWNLQIFGQSKASNESLLKYYAEKLDDYDLFIVQEIRDSSGIAIKKLAEKLINEILK